VEGISNGLFKEALAVFIQTGTEGNNENLSL
jgi:hypothetical protein